MVQSERNCSCSQYRHLWYIPLINCLLLLLQTKMRNLTLNQVGQTKCAKAPNYISALKQATHSISYLHTVTYDTIEPGLIISVSYPTPYEACFKATLIPHPSFVRFPNTSYARSRQKPPGRSSSTGIIIPFSRAAPTKVTILSTTSRFKAS